MQLEENGVNYFLDNSEILGLKMVKFKLQVLTAQVLLTNILLIYNKQELLNNFHKFYLSPNI